jgi:ABC-type polar amino acid transport system ATPase subunit
VTPAVICNCAIAGHLWPFVSLAREGMTMLVVTHEMGFARKVADRVVFMSDGKQVEAAPPDRFFDHPAEERTQRFLSKILGH